MSQPPPQLDDGTYNCFRSLILKRSGLYFPDKRRQNLERGLLQTFSATSCQDLDAYYDFLLGSPTNGQEWEQLIRILTVGETYFFRDKAQFTALRQHVFPEIVGRKRLLGRRLRVWTAGCATGEEPYSIAMLLRDLFPDIPKQNVSIVATDINREALAQARAGLYGEWSFREKGWEDLQRRYFGRQGEMWELSPEIRSMVSFAYLNLVEDAYPSLANNTVAFDLIICRNVTIYFTPEITQRVVSRLCKALVRGGWLILGHSEPAPDTCDQLVPHNFSGAVLYFKSEDSLSPAPGRSTQAKRPQAPPQALSMPLNLDQPAPLPLPKAAVQETVPTPKDFYAQATTLLEQGRRREALERLDQALEIDPDFVGACYLVAKIQAGAGSWQQAHRWCERALEQDPLMTEAHFLLALIHSQEGNPDKALVEIKRVVFLDRDAVLGHFWLANLYQDMGDEARAHKSLENTARLLEKLPPESSIPWSDGMTASRLGYIVERRMNG